MYVKLTEYEKKVANILEFGIQNAKSEFEIEQELGLDEAKKGIVSSCQLNLMRLRFPVGFTFTKAGIKWYVISNEEEKRAMLDILTNEVKRMHGLINSSVQRGDLTEQRMLKYVMRDYIEMENLLRMMDVDVDEE